MFPKNALAICAVVLALVSGARAAAPRYVILFVGSGLGPEQLKAASIYLHGTSGRLALQNLPHSAEVRVMPAADGPADEAAAATGLATGKIVNRGVISMNIPGSAQDNPNAETVLEYSRRHSGHTLGIVTDSYLTDAAPAAFIAHQPTYENPADIARDYIERTRPHIMMGRLGQYLTPENAENAGYTVVADAEGLASYLDEPAAGPLCGLFPPDGVPDLAQMTQAAIHKLQDAPDGFFLLVHAGGIGRAVRANNLQECISQIAMLDSAVEVARDWAKDRKDALLMVTGTIEIGGLEVLTNYGIGRLPEVHWSTTEETGGFIPVYAMGRNADIVSMIEDGKNTELCVVLTFDPGHYSSRPRSRTTSIAIAVSFALLVIMWLTARRGRRADLDW